jgi:hypothetical protein
MTNDTSTETTETLLNALAEDKTARTGTLATRGSATPLPDEERRMYLRAIIRRLEADAMKSASTLAKLASVLTLLALFACGGAVEPVTGQAESSDDACEFSDAGSGCIQSVSPVAECYPPLTAHGWGEWVEGPADGSWEVCPRP